MKMLRPFTVLVGATLALGLFTEASAAERLQNVVRRLSGPEGQTGTNAARTFRCAGTVVDADGKPVAGAVVECYQYGGGGRAVRRGRHGSEAARHHRNGRRV